MDREETLPLVDFHLHTTASDGCRTPAQVVERALALGLCRMAVTDHDTVAGVPAAVRAAAGRIPLVPGVEFTCREEVLALGLDGLEAYYLDFSEAQRAELAALAGQQELYCTAGSDCHGFAHRDRMSLPCSPALLAALPPVLRG